ncbi:MAG: hypothetical protein MSK39_06910 [Dysosmobacter sp.]|nr:hypothetical protein [Dysosmobacter sp.]
MRRFSAMNTAMTAAACHAADRSACANMHIALILDAILLASIFVALLNLLGLICLPLILVSLLVLLALRTTHCRLKDTTFA